jgi:hypothetical protein
MHAIGPIMTIGEYRPLMHDLPELPPPPPRPTPLWIRGAAALMIGMLAGAVILGMFLY